MPKKRQQHILNLHISNYSERDQMEENELRLKSLEEVFRYGEEVQDGAIIRKYQNCLICLIYKYHAGDV